MSKRKYPPISVHQTLNGQLEVNWEQEYQNEFYCPYCKTGILTGLFRREQDPCKLRLSCESCRKRTYLTKKIPGTGFKYSPISTHQTLNEILKVNWKQDYQKEYKCPRCNQGKLTNYYYKPNHLGNLVLDCDFCQKYTYLTCPVPIHIYRYCPDIECPNPLCNEIGHDGQKGWIYKIENKTADSKCHFCGIYFRATSIKSYSWVGGTRKDKLLLFNFNEDRWDLKNFYDNPNKRFLNFQEIYPQWYRIEVKKYLHYLLKSRVFSSDSRIYHKTITLRQFGQALQQNKIKQLANISRESLLSFLEICQKNKSTTINQKLSTLQEFLEWLGLPASYLIRRRDFVKVSRNEADWLDEVTRTAIKQHLTKIPKPIAYHYLVQEYTAARSGDVCQIAFNCLVEDNGKWYVKFYQHKVARWHKIPATREIRQVIEEQQQWIQQTLGADYPYLFCHFRTIRTESYPVFSNIKPLLIPPKVEAAYNPMVRIIRMLIEKEDIRDANGQKPHFTGKIIRPSRLQEVRTKYGMEAARLYADHKSSITTFQHYAPPTREQLAEVDLPFQELLMNPDNKFLPWQSLPESLLKNPKAHELDLDIAPRLVVYGHCALDPKTPCPINLFPKCYGCSSFRPSTGKLPLYERQYEGEQQRLTEAETAGAELASEEAKATIEAMDKWLPELRRLANA